MKGTQFESGNCVYATYSLRDDGLVNVFNEEIDDKGEYNSATGKAKQTSNPAALKVSFFGPLWLTGANYKIIETNYDDYSVIYSCSNYGFFYTEYAWILSRKRRFEVAESSQLETLNSLGVSEDELIINDLDACANEI